MTTGAEQGTLRALARLAAVTTASPPNGSEERLLKDLDVLRVWLTDYIGQPDRRLNRKGPVCPFVPAAVKSGALKVKFRYEITGEDSDGLTSLLRDELERFMAGETGSLDSLVVVLPDLVDAGLSALDEAHARLKDAAVAGGAMIGQFHPECDERSVRNAEFRVSRS